MGYDAYACAVIGVRHPPGVIKANLFRDETRRVCDHEMAEGMKHCPECGAPRTTTFPVPIPEYDADDEKLCGCYGLVNRGEGYYDDPEFIAFWYSGDVAPRETVFEKIGAVDWPYIREKMKERLEPLGLWNAERFGLHVFLVESC